MVGLPLVALKQVVVTSGFFLTESSESRSIAVNPPQFPSLRSCCVIATATAVRNRFPPLSPESRGCSMVLRHDRSEGLIAFLTERSESRSIAVNPLQLRRKIAFLIHLLSISASQSL
ncbi:hypothetical protein L6452_03443 [Arctium lappa]|uniref:Uncharacterized protein n=1 Tax=Arctium lappa TaxID=4217 RepID=A0ACB9FN63_ARCLA|nr:hypothetical protein L6452_03443 [Arctium lappa]